MIGEKGLEWVFWVLVVSVRALRDAEPIVHMCVSVHAHKFSYLLYMLSA